MTQGEHRQQRSTSSLCNTIGPAVVELVLMLVGGGGGGVAGVCTGAGGVGVDVCWCLVVSLSPSRFYSLPLYLQAHTLWPVPDLASASNMKECVRPNARMAAYEEYEREREREDWSCYGRRCRHR